MLFELKCVGLHLDDSSKFLMSVNVLQVIQNFVWERTFMLHLVEYLVSLVLIYQVLEASSQLSLWNHIKLYYLF